MCHWNLVSWIRGHARGVLLLPLLWAEPVFAEAPPAMLSQNTLYADIATKKVAAENSPYAPNYPLWSDGAAKSRWVYLPEGGQIDTNDPDHWIFPVGTKLWKEFAFKDPRSGQLHRVETRLMTKVQGSDGPKWRYYTYVWDQNGSDAKLDSGMGQQNVWPTGETSSHDIPGRTDCIYCHDNGGEPVLGFTALQLSSSRDPKAPHAEDRPIGSLTLSDLIALGRLTHQLPDPIEIVAANGTERAALGYLHSNCGNCHNPRGNAAFSGLMLNYPLKDHMSLGQQPALQTGVNKPTTQFKGLPLRISGGNPDASAIVARMRVFGHVYPRMPMMGSETVDEAGVDLLSEWIRSLPAP